MAGIDRDRESLVRMVAPTLRTGERVIAVLPYVHTPKRPKGPEGKVREGIFQSYRRYRPLVVTDRRLLVFDTGRTPHARGLLASFSLSEVGVVAVEAAGFGVTRVMLDLPGVGPVPFAAGRKERHEVAVLLEGLAGPSPFHRLG